MAPIVHVAVASLTLVLVKTLVELISESFRSPLENLPGPWSPSWLRGHMDQLFHPQGWDFHLKSIVDFGTAVRLRGFLGEDVLYLTDPAGLRTIFSGERGDIYDEFPMIVQRNTLLRGHRFLSSNRMAGKRKRQILNMIFSAQRMRKVMPAFWDVTRRLEDTLVNLSHGGPTELDMLAWMSRVSLELIGQAGIGVSFDTLAEKTPPSDYMLASKQLIPLWLPLRGFMRFIPSIVNRSSPAFRGFLAKIAPHPDIRKLRKIVYFLYDTHKSIYRQRAHAIAQAENDSARGPAPTDQDIISVLIQQNKCANMVDKLSDSELISQMGTLILAGQHMTSIGLSRILHVLSLHPERQHRLRVELMDARVERRDISYDDLMALPYLDAVCKETLRLYSPVTQLHLVPRKDTSIPLSRPVIGRDGQVIDCVHVRAGTMVVVGTAAVNRDPVLWGPDADQWIPERWLGPLPEAVTDAYSPGVSSHMMALMGGGRPCMGFKFAEAEIKAVLYVLLSRITFGPPEKPILWDTHSFATPTVKGRSLPSMPLKVTLLSG